MNEINDDKPAEPLVQDDWLLMQIENYKAEPAFFELLDTAKIICLAGSEVYDNALHEVRQKRAETEESRLLRRLGLWGCRAALDAPTEYALYDHSDAADGFVVADLLTSPHAFSASPEKAIQDHIEAFGKAILDETFACLGADAADKAEAYKKSSDDSEQQAIMVWLVERVEKIGKKPDEVFRAEINQLAASIDESTERYLEGCRQRDEALANVDPAAITTAHEENDSLNEHPEFNNNFLRDDYDEEAEAVEVAYNDHYSYHPTRLSPKLLGVYPENKLVPTCLGISLLMASFFEKTGAPYLHAGIMQTSMHAGRVELLLNAERVQDFLETMPEAQAAYGKELLGRMHDELWKIIDVNRGHHAAIIAQLHSGEWTYLDPNYRTLIRTGDDTLSQSKLDATYDALKDIDTHIAGVEATHTNNHGMQALFYTQLLGFIENAEPPEEIYWDYAAAAAKDDGGLDIFKRYMMMYLTRDHWGNEPTVIDELTDTLVLPHVGKNKETYIDEILTGILENIVFKDIAPEDRRAYFEACATSPENHPEFIASVKLAPRFMALKLQQDFVNALGGINLPPASSEVALPHYRIGATVLSDYAIYCGVELPGSFWTTYWPSQITFNDHVAAQENLSDFQMRTALRMLEYIELLGTLRYINTYGIVKKFLEQEGVLTNGYHQESAGKVAG